MSACVFTLWCVYDHPKDYPREFVARRHDVHPGMSVPTEEVIVSEKLEPLREELSGKGLQCIGRHGGDDPCILEVWL